MSQRARDLATNRRNLRIGNRPRVDKKLSRMLRSQGKKGRSSTNSAREIRPNSQDPAGWNLLAAATMLSLEPEAKESPCGTAPRPLWGRGEELISEYRPQKTAVSNLQARNLAAKRPVLSKRMETGQSWERRCKKERHPFSAARPSSGRSLRRSRQRLWPAGGRRKNWSKRPVRGQNRLRPRLERPRCSLPKQSGG